MPTSSTDDSTDRAPDAQVSTLDRRREKLQGTRAAAESAIGRIAALDELLETNSTRQREHEAGLQAALDRVATLKKAIKAATKRDSKLLTARKDARRLATRAQQRAATAETKYDRAVLADMVRREKDDDLSRHQPGVGGRRTTTDQPDTGTTTARATRPAARRTPPATTRARRSPTAAANGERGVPATTRTASQPKAETPTR